MKIRFDENEYQKFIEIDLNEDILNSYERDYFSDNMEFLDVGYKISFQYSMGLHYSDLFKLNAFGQQNSKELDKAIWRTEEKYNKPIFWYLTALQEYFYLEPSADFEFHMIKRIYVNLGNEYMLQLRYFEAIDSYDEALKIDPSFSMAFANKLYAIEKLILLKQYVDQGKLFNYISSQYKKLSPSKMENGQEQFKEKKRYYHHLEKKYQALFHAKKLCFNPSNKLTINKEDNVYTDFIYENSLVINPISYLGKYDEGLNDQVLTLEATKEYDADFEELTKEFVFFREKLFLHWHLEHKESIYEIALSFKGLYSLFDKTAYFIYKFFDLDLAEDKIYYSKIWKSKTKNGVPLLDIKCTHLYALYWINREYRTNGTLHNELFPPDSQQLWDLRNKLEHRLVRQNNEENIMMVLKTNKLAHVIRNILLYLNMLICDESNPALYENGKRNLDLVYLPLDTGMWNMFSDCISDKL